MKNNTVINMAVFNNLRTGDIILYDSQDSGFYGYIEYFIKLFTGSNYTHIGIVIKEENLGVKKLDINKTYLWESGYEGKPDPQDGRIKLGVQLTNLDHVIKRHRGKLYVRKLDCPNNEARRIFNHEILEKIHGQVYGKPYDYNIVDWLGAFCRSDFRPQKIDRFWCSAFVGYVLTQVKILSDKTDWSILRPCDFSPEDEDKHLSYQTNVIFEKQKYLLCTNI